MQEKPKDACPPTAEEPGQKDDNWADDQKRRSDYYDDAHGYQEYSEEENEGEEDA